VNRILGNNYDFMKNEIRGGEGPGSNCLGILGLFP